LIAKQLENYTIKLLIFIAEKAIAIDCFERLNEETSSGLFNKEV